MRPPSCEGQRPRRQPVKRANTFRNSSNDKNAADMLKFVRDVQFERQNTSNNLNLKAPLPGINHKKSMKHDSFDSGFVERVADNTDSDEDVFDVPIPTVREHKPKIDSELVGMLTEPQNVNRNSNDQRVLSRLRSNLDSLNNNTDVCRRQGDSKKHHNISKNSKSFNPKSRTARLPPLEREHFPDRPSAPPPCHTPSDDYSDDFEYLDL